MDFISPKTTLVADNIHYPIPITQLEKKIISTQVFNRLHNILQNSTVYLTYPSNRTTRFIHSLGVMHIAGQIFQHSINNASSEVRAKFFDHTLDQIKNIRAKELFRNDTRNYVINHEERECIEKYSIDLLNDKLYLTALPGGLTSDHQYAFIIVYQSLRLAALLHDLGHPPLSHVTEQALEELKLNLYSKRDRRELLTDREQTFIKIVDSIEGKFHEGLGETLGSKLLSNLLPECTKTDDLNTKKCRYEILTIRNFVQCICTEPNYFESLHEIYAADLDADRLDYVSRDMFNSGLLAYPLNYGRLIQSYQLVYQKTEDGTDSDKPGFLPSVRSLSTIEDFYRQRFSLYKHVIFHHRVTKTDGLFKAVIVKIAQDYLSSPTPKHTDHTQSSNSAVSYLLPREISALWDVMAPNQLDFDNDIIYHYIQWDDAWLLSMLRKKFFELHHRYEKHNDLSNEEEVLRIQLEEVLSNQKRYRSLFKRVDTFIPIDNTFLESVPEDFEWGSLEDKIQLYFQMSGAKVTPAPFKEKILGIIKYAKEYNHAKLASRKNQIESLRESQGFFVTNLVLLLRETLHLNSGSPIPHSEGMEFAVRALRDLQVEFGLFDAIIMPRFIMPGVNNQLKLIIEGQHETIINIGAISRIADDLRRSAKLFPPFFVYTYKGTNPEDLDIEKMRIVYGKYLWDEFYTWFKSFPQRS